MLAGAYDRSRAHAWEGAHGTVLPEVDPTDETGADIRNVSQPERRLLFAILADAIVRLRRMTTAPRHATRELLEAEADGKPFTLCLLDVDDFKRINDLFGHPDGDRLLAELPAHLDRIDEAE